jgi:hypothetical protein
MASGPDDTTPEYLSWFGIVACVHGERIMKKDGPTGGEGVRSTLQENLERKCGDG